MSYRKFKQQTEQKQLTLFKHALQFEEVASQVVIQRIPASYLHRILKPLLRARDEAENPDEIDPASFIRSDMDDVERAIFTFDSTFAECKEKRVDMLSSMEAIARRWDIEKSAGEGCVFLAWKTTYGVKRDGTKGHRAPELVGAATVNRFRSWSDFSTDRSDMSAYDFGVLSGARPGGSTQEQVAAKNYFQSHTMYIDSVCAKHKSGVGRVLVLHAIRYAIMKRCTGIIALAFSAYANKAPESKEIFKSLKFDTIIPKANFTSRLYGTWFYLPLSGRTYEHLVQSGAINVCTRSGFTPKTEDTLVWRCPR